MLVRRYRNLVTQFIICFWRKNFINHKNWSCIDPLWTYSKYIFIKDLLKSTSINHQWLQIPGCTVQPPVVLYARIDLRVSWSLYLLPPVRACLRWLSAHLMLRLVAAVPLTNILSCILRFLLKCDCIIYFYSFLISQYLLISVDSRHVVVPN